MATDQIRSCCGRPRERPAQHVSRLVPQSPNNRPAAPNQLTLRGRLLLKSDAPEAAIESFPSSTIASPASEMHARNNKCAV